VTALWADLALIGPVLLTLAALGWLVRIATRPIPGETDEAPPTPPTTPRAWREPAAKGFRRDHGGTVVAMRQRQQQKGKD